MAAPNASPTVAGGANIAASARTVSNDQTLFLKKWSGEFHNAYQVELNISKTIARHSISGAKSYQWPINSRATAGPKAPGVYTIGDDAIRFNEQEIFVDRSTYAEHFVDNVDELHAHYDIRSPIIQEQARALARYDEDKALGALSQAAALDAPDGMTYIDPEDGTTDYGLAANRATANVLTGITTMAALRASDFSVLAGLIADQHTRYYNLGIDPYQAMLILDPQTYMAFKRSTEGQKLIDRDLNAEAGYDYRNVPIPTTYGIKIVKSTNWLGYIDKAAANTPLNGDASLHRNTYNPNNTDVAGLFYTPQSAGCLDLHGLQVTASREELVDSLLLRHKITNGYGPLRPETCFPLKLDTP